METLLGEEAFEGAAARERAVRRVLEAIEPLGDPLRRHVYLEELSTRLGVSYELLENELRQLRSGDASSRRRALAPVPAARVGCNQASGSARSPTPRQTVRSR